MVKSCRLMVYKSKRVVKLADCSQSMTPETTLVRSCITKKMLEINRTFKWSDGFENGKKEFYECLDQVFE